MNKSKTDFKPIAIGYDKIEESNHKIQLRQKTDAFKAILNIAEKHIDNVDKKALYKEPYKYIESEVMKANEKQFKGVSFYKIAFLIDLDITELNEVIDKLKKTELEINPETLEAATPDFKIYTLNEDENRLYYALQQSVKGLNLYKSIMPYVQFNYILSGIKYNPDEKKYEVDSRNIIYNRSSRA